MEGERDCPNGWTCSDECSYWSRYIKQCTYSEEERVDLKEIAVKIEQQTKQKAKVDAEVIKHKNDDEDWFGKWLRLKPPNIHSIEPYKVMSGPTAPGGGGTIKVKKSKRGNKPTVYVWGENP